ncbi:hypothetical protein CSOJ01_11361 [Colletotrichum sojae]|uniref:Uncharacterized protein n=1 Tax=Colletotrichum sojae TaxID=2175907 RepID=A0A8H6IYN5_9PEZI|nr:hypothetical protein CSOJ01_11361 [Colletotrichum sojae]
MLRLLTRVMRRTSSSLIENLVVVITPIILPGRSSTAAHMPAPIKLDLIGGAEAITSNSDRTRSTRPPRAPLSPGRDSQEFTVRARMFVHHGSRVASATGVPASS